jgi:hypothetical protein
MKTVRSSTVWSWSLFLAPLILLPFAGGCMFIQAPAPDPTPTPVPEPTGVIFRPGDYNPMGQALNSASDATLPEFYRLSRIESAELVWLQGYRNNKVFRAPNVFHLAGIVAPRPNQPGWESSVKTLNSWAGGQNLTVYLDQKLPYDLNNHQVVNIVFKGRKGGKWADQDMSLNRMLVRSGYALVDLYSATSFDVKDWLKDEAYARLNRLGLWQIPNIFQTLQQRRPAPPKGAKTGSKVTVTTGGAPAPAPAPGAAPEAPPAGTTLTMPGGVPLRTPASGAPPGAPATPPA